MNLLDVVNAGFIGAYVYFNWLNVWTLWRTRRADGVSVGMFAFFVVWGAWQLYFYASLAQWWSVLTTALATAGNLAWVVLVVYWGRHRNTRVPHGAEAPRT